MSGRARSISTESACVEVRFQGLVETTSRLGAGERGAVKDVPSEEHDEVNELSFETDSSTRTRFCYLVNEDQD